MRLATLAAMAVLALLAAACGGGGVTPEAVGATDGAEAEEAKGTEAAEEITIRVSTFGRFGYADLYEQYMEEHPNVTIVESAEGDLGLYNQQLTQRLAAGGGVGDIVAIEEGLLSQFLAQPDQYFVNYLDYGAEELKDNWLEWKWNQSLSADGEYQLGLGTDVGGLAMCYRTDLFEQAGLPTDRDEVSQLWPTWEDFRASGEKFMAGIGDDKVAFVDAATNVFNPILMQSGDKTYFDRDGSFIMESNPAIREAWDTSVDIADAGLTAKLKSFSPEWNAGFKNGAFATIACPAWMTGYIEGQAGDAGKGKWDIASVPGGGGNWGGSFLAVTKASEHPDAAVELAKFLTSPEGQLAAFEAEGNLPSSPTLYDDPALSEATNEYFSDAPVGEIFVAGAAELEPLYLGPQNQPVRDAVENALRAVEQGQLSPDEGWQKALIDGEKAAN